MSAGVGFLHSHSGIERDLKFPKDVVLVDVCYENIFEDVPHKPFMFKKHKFLQVNILNFLHKGGVFKNLYK